MTKPPLPNLALFDFDGTITSSDTFGPFLFFAATPARKALGRLVLSPLIVAYKLRMLSPSRLRRIAARFVFRSRRESEVRQAGVEYSRSRLANVVRPHALERIRWHQAQGDEVVVVSASLDVYLADWCQKLGVELLCTELEAREGVLTGHYRSGDCCGEEKAKRVQERYDLQRFGVVYAY
ncbi:MAG TPA: HAD-IB family phosphatase, partial [Polyangiaceae bacterium]|nr:HAD-IB family phosphatase [Polyangiaceae bacterium]